MIYVHAMLCYAIRKKTKTVGLFHFPSSLLSSAFQKKVRKVRMIYVHVAMLFEKKSEAV